MVFLKSLHLLALLLCSWLGYSQATTQAQVAVFVLSQEGNPCFLPPNYPLINNMSTSLPTWSYELVIRGISATDLSVRLFGGIPVGTGSTASSLFLNVSYINIGPRSLSTNITDLVEASKRAASFAFSHLGGAIAWIPVIRDLPAVEIFSEACESSGTCLMITPLVTSEELFRCNDTPDCVARGRGIGSRRFLMTFGCLPDDTYALYDLYQVAKEKHANTAAVIASVSNFGQTALYGSRSTLRTLHITEVAEFSIGPHTSFSKEDAMAIALQLKEKDPDVLTLFVQPAEAVMCLYLIEAMKKIDWFPRAFGNAGACVGNAYPNGGNSAYIYYQVPWHHDVQGLDYHAAISPVNFEPFPASVGEDSPQFYSRFIQENSGVPPALQVISVLGTSAAVIVVKALSETSKPNPVAADMIETLRTISVPSVYGRISFDTHGRVKAGTRTILQIFDQAGNTRVFTPRMGDGTTKPTSGMCAYSVCCSLQCPPFTDRPDLAGSYMG